MTEDPGVEVLLLQAGPARHQREHGLPILATCPKAPNFDTLHHEFDPTELSDRLVRDPRHDILFEAVPIGPVTTKNRFYQVPHCSGMGWKRPRSLAAMRGVKAEGGWGVVCTEYCSVHPSSDDGAYPYATLWDKGDIKAHALMTDAVHAHGALAGVELWIGGGYTTNLDTRLESLGLRSYPSGSMHRGFPLQSRRMDKIDIAKVRQWQADAARRAVQAGFDIVYVYATHGYLLSEFLDASFNDRTDEYGGSLENRTRIVCELIDVTREAVAGKCAVATRSRSGARGRAAKTGKRGRVSHTRRPSMRVGRFHRGARCVHGQLARTGRGDSDQPEPEKD